MEKLYESVLPSIANILLMHIDGSYRLKDRHWDTIMHVTSGVLDPMGQWKHPGKCTMIPTTDGSITMHRVPFEVIGIDETGHAICMKPEQNYQYTGKNIFEIPNTGRFKTLAIQLKNAIENGSKYTK